MIHGGVTAPSFLRRPLHPAAFILLAPSPILSPMAARPELTDLAAGTREALAKGIAEAMGGRITVVSKVGVGSRFTLHLPLAKALETETIGAQRVAQV